MAYEHAIVEVDKETWSSLVGPRDAYDAATKTWDTVPVTTWSMIGTNTWGGASNANEIEIETLPLAAQVNVRCPNIKPTELEFASELNVVSGNTDFYELLINSMPWYMRDDEVIKNVCRAGGAMLATVESYLLLVSQSMHLDSSINMLENHEAELGIQAGRLNLTQRRDNIRRIWHMMNENVSWSPNELYYLPFVGEWSTGNQHVDGTVIHDSAHKNNPIVQAKVEQWANVNGLKVVE